jgi:hypothetical protein
MAVGVSPVMACELLWVAPPGGAGTIDEPVDPVDPPLPVGGAGTFDEDPVEPGLPAVGGGGTFDGDPVEPGLPAVGGGGTYGDEPVPGPAVGGGGTVGRPGAVGLEAVWVPGAGGT